MVCAPTINLLVLGAIMLAQPRPVYLQGNVSALGTSFADISTVKPSDPKSDGWKMQYLPRGFTARGVTLWQLVQEAYGVYEEHRIEGLAKWEMTQRFDVEARLESGSPVNVDKLPTNQKRALLQKLLEKRFALKVHEEQREMSILSLEKTKTQPKMHPSDEASMAGASERGVDAVVTRSTLGDLEGNHFSMQALAFQLTMDTGRMVQDHTGLSGYYDVQLHWTPEQLAMSTTTTDQHGVLDNQEAGPSIYTAVKEQLGLELLPKKGRVSVVVVDHADPPQGN